MLIGNVRVLCWLNAKAGRLADRSGRRDKTLKRGTGPPKMGRMVRLFIGGG